MTAIQIKSIGICAPGIPDWASARALLNGQADWRHAAMKITAPDILPANERRRLSPVIKLALQAAHQAIGSQRDDPAMLSVFASSYGDLDITHSICCALVRPERPVSPTQFHNSVHNAPAGYWSIAKRSPAASISIAAADFSFAAGLLESASLIQAEGHPVLLVAYDLPTESPLSAQLQATHGFACALLLTPSSSTDGFTISLRTGAEETACNDVELEQLRRDNPAARSLPLLQLLAGGTEAGVALSYLHQQYVHVERNG